MATTKSHTQKQADMGDFLRSDVSILSSKQKFAALQFLSECKYCEGHMVVTCSIIVSSLTSPPLSPTHPHSARCSAVEAFSDKHISKNVLKKLLQKDIAREITQQEVEPGDLCLYKNGTVANYFLLILEGCVEVTIGKEGLSFEGRAFSSYGHQVLVDAYNGVESHYAPDFTLRPVTACVVLIVTYNQYVAALRATSFGQERHNSLAGGGGGGGEVGSSALAAASAPDHFMSEWKKAKSEDHNAESSVLATIVGVLHQRLGPRKSRSKSKAPDKQMLLPSDDAVPYDVDAEKHEKQKLPGYLEQDAVVTSSGASQADAPVLEIPEQGSEDFPVWFKSKAEQGQRDGVSKT